MGRVEANVTCDLLVIGGGPGGYAAAFRAADLGLDVVIADERAALGGVCLNVGCIPSKTYLHQAALIRDAAGAAHAGVRFGAPEIDLDALRAHKNAVVGKLTGGLGGLAKAREVRLLHGRASFTGPNTGAVGGVEVGFRHCVIAVGSAPVRLPILPDDPRVLDSTSALELPTASGRLLVIGGGIIGLELATIYATLGVTVDIVELTNTLMPGTDTDLVAVWEKANRPFLGDIMVGTKVVSAVAGPEGIRVTFAGAQAPEAPRTYDYVLGAVGRTSNGGAIDAGKAGVQIDQRGFVFADIQMRTSASHIFAIGDVVGGPMLAHKAAHQGHVAAEVIAGEQRGDAMLARAAFDARVIPTVVYTSPEIASAGLTEAEARASGTAVEVHRFPWAASGRAIANGCENGFTKLLVETATGVVVGGAIVGPGAGDIIGEIALAVEMGAEAADLALTIHPHPTLGESIGLAAELAIGVCTDLPPARDKNRGKKHVTP